MSRGYAVKWKAKGVSCGINVYDTIKLLQFLDVKRVLKTGAAGEKRQAHPLVGHGRG